MPIGTAEAVTKVAQRAEALGYSSLWTIERLLYPLKPQTPYPGTPDGSLPEVYRHTLDPLEALTYVAGQTKKIKLGTSVLDMPYAARPQPAFRKVRFTRIRPSTGCSSCFNVITP